jgi:hypothetical protein
LPVAVGRYSSRAPRGARLVQSAVLEDERDQKNDQDDEKYCAESDVHVRSSLLSVARSLITRSGSTRKPRHSKSVFVPVGRGTERAWDS